MSKCVVCKKGKLVKTKHYKYEFASVFIGEYPAELCTRCGEAYFDEKVVEKIQERTKELGLFGIGKKLSPMAIQKKLQK